jgi:hypothetical protein
MDDDLFSVLKLCAICAGALFCIGFIGLLVAIRRSRYEFREKGYLRPPAGTRWFRFLLQKQYDSFEDAGARFCYAMTHFCLLGVIIALAAAGILVTSEVVLNGLNGLSGFRSHVLPSK